MHKILVHSLSKAFHAVRDGWRDVAVALGMAVALLGMGPAYANVDVNTADEAALTALKGIGPATAKRILDERDKHGAFQDAADLADRVPGVGSKSAANLEASGLTFGKPAAAPKATRKDARPVAKSAQASSQKPAATR
ncbi:helix-hairpin-helix domain-containing protein [Cupriavidus sp. 2SB]|uniref:ComEA family DNA-binding protein n=1 Tax=Cupriavidus sp. 2SB TaxID=2502199 RepID=UPI0010F8DC1A|nr:helix-hairpin-helix domain-containing protein [Cupriavidus sp. 2SB]